MVPNLDRAGSEGTFVTTEPVGTDSWMPLNNHPLAKPTYDFDDTTNIGKTAVGPGELVGYTPPAGTTYQPVPPPTTNAPDANFPAGSGTWHWHSPEGIANYLVENRRRPVRPDRADARRSGVQYWEAQANSITVAKKATNETAMDNQEDIVNFQRGFNGPWPLTTDGILVGTPSASFEEEMQGKITFARRLDRPVARHVQPREHAPVVRRRRRRGRVQPDVLEGRLRHAR